MNQETPKCNQSGVCCKLFLININEEEYNSKKFKTIFQDLDIPEDATFEQIELMGANILAQHEDESCIYL